MLDNVDIVVEDEPTPQQAARNRARERAERPESDGEDGLFGLYEGIPLTERGQGYSMVLPDKITIFRGPLERACRSRQELMREVRITVVHELGHHLGIGEERLEELGWA
jgi:predicted Zn-dependent protease with MMP-like domain